MKWVTRARPKTDRIACPWLIKKFIDPEAEILYVDPERVLEAAEREEAHSFDAPEARYTHRAANAPSRCSSKNMGWRETRPSCASHASCTAQISPETKTSRLSLQG
jgi:hypothetical protein